MVTMVTMVRTCLPGSAMWGSCVQSPHKSLQVWCSCWRKLHLFRFPFSQISILNFDASAAAIVRGIEANGKGIPIKLWVMDCHYFLHLAWFGIVGTFSAWIAVVIPVTESQVKLDFVGNTGLDDMTCFCSLATPLFVCDLRLGLETHPICLGH